MALGGGAHVGSAQGVAAMKAKAGPSSKKKTYPACQRREKGGPGCASSARRAGLPEALMHCGGANPEEPEPNSLARRERKRAPGGAYALLHRCGGAQQLEA